MKYIVGLGNPGKEYEKTRHNIGQDIVEGYVSRHGLSSWYTPSHGDFKQSTGEVDGEEIMCIVPMTFMNKSGIALSHVIKTESDLQNLVVVHDELDVAEGEVKNTTKRGSGGNRGVESIIEMLGSKEFDRVRIGIGLANEEGQVIKFAHKSMVSDFVLKPFETESAHDEIVEVGIKRLEEVLKNK